MSGAATLQSLADAWADAPPRIYGRTRLIDIHGQPIRASKLATETNYVFHYPYESTPCFLLKLPRAGDRVEACSSARTATATRGTAALARERSIVAFSAICAHKLAYPTREVSFIRYQKDRSATSGAAVIHCCADHSVYDPAQGARVVSGPAPQPLAAILLEHEPASDELAAVGTVGAEQFDAFFVKYGVRLEFEYGPGKAKRPIGDRAVVRELETYCKTTIRC